MIKMSSDFDTFGFAVVVFLVVATMAYLFYVIKKVEDDGKDAVE